MGLAARAGIFLTLPIDHATGIRGSAEGDEDRGAEGAGGDLVFVCVSPLVLVDDAADWARGGGACQAGEARALVASARGEPRGPISAAGQAEAMAILMRRQDDADQRPDLQELKPDGAAGGVRKGGFSKADAPQGADQHIGHRRRTTAAVGWRAWSPPRCGRRRGRAGIP